MSAPVCRGYDKAIFNPSSIVQFECLSCGLVAQKPFEAPCGHRYCGSFAQNLSGEMKCMDNDCDEKFRKEDLREDKAAYKDILRLECRCGTSTECPWRGTFAKLSQHEMECDYKPYICPRCDEKLLLKAKQEHDQSCDKGPCKFRDVGCKEKELVEYYKLNSLESSFPEVAYKDATASPGELHLSPVQSRPNRTLSENGVAFGYGSQGAMARTPTNIGISAAARRSLPPVLSYALASYDYASTEPNQISLKCNDRVAIVSKAGGEKGWWKGYVVDAQGNPSGRVGFFPLAYVEEDEA